jgi:hypothetical protein
MSYPITYSNARKAIFFSPKKKKKKEKRMLGWCCNVYNHDDDRSALELIARVGLLKKKLSLRIRLRGRNIPKENRPAAKNASY